MALLLDEINVPDKWTLLEAVVVMKCMDDEGEVRMAYDTTDSISSWEAIGLLTVVEDSIREELSMGMIDPEDD